MTMPAKTKLKTLLGRTWRTEALLDGEVSSDRVELDCDPIKQVTDGFPSVVREMRYDFSELALLTALQAREAGKPLTILPVALLTGDLHPYVHYNSERGFLKPEDVAGKRIGVRSYTQTTGLWIRGFLEDQYGVPLERQHWVTMQEPHVQEYRDPDFVEHVSADKPIVQMLLDGDIDVAVGLLPGVTDPHPQLKRLFPDGSSEQWRERTSIVPINHVAVMKESLHRSDPTLAPELVRLLTESEAKAKGVSNAADRRQGLEAHGGAIVQLIKWAVRQKLLREDVSIEQLFDPVTMRLGSRIPNLASEH